MKGEVRVPSPRQEVVLLACLVSCFLVLNGVTASLSPTVWQDEVMLADPAINLRLFGRFVSTAWSEQGAQELWSGNAPLHSLALAGWLLVMPISPGGVRSINYVFIVLAAVFFWLSLLRSGFLRTSGARLLFVVLLLCGYGVAFSYRSGRYDMIGALLLALMAFALTLRNAKARSFCLAAFAALMPWAGLQVVVFVTALLIVTLLVKRRIEVEHIAVASGMGFGAAALLGLYAWAGTFDQFVASLRSHTSAAALSNWQRAASLPALYVQDYSSLALLPAVALLPSMKKQLGALEWEFALICAFAVFITPLTLGLAGKFPIYYTWMPYVFLIALVAFLLERLWVMRPWAAKAVLTMCLIASLALPTRLAVAVLEMGARDYEPAARYVANVVGPDDEAYVDYPAYYPAKLVARAVYVPSYLPAMAPSERRSVTVAIVSHRCDSPRDAAAALGIHFEGEWTPAAPPFESRFRAGAVRISGAARLYSLCAFRRKR